MNVFMVQPSTDVSQAPSLQDFPYYYVQELQMGSMHNIAQIYLSLDYFFLFLFFFEYTVKHYLGNSSLENSKLRNCFISLEVIVWLASAQKLSCV